MWFDNLEKQYCDYFHRNKVLNTIDTIKQENNK